MLIPKISFITSNDQISGGSLQQKKNKMLGRVRVSPLSSLETLEMERQPPKIMKHDSFSIYETTLLKLKEGSKCNTTPENVEAQCPMVVDAPEETEMLTDDDISQNSRSDLQFTYSVQQYETRNKSILQFFTKCNSFPDAQITSDNKPISEISSPCSVLPTSSILQVIKENP